jgi:dolichyl-phosphate beta-glucosyltransferase
MAPELSIIFPAYNEAAVIRQNLLQVQKKLHEDHLEYEIIVVDDGSTDDTLGQAQLLEDAHLKVFASKPNRGKGYAVKLGMQKSQGAYRLFMDVDLSTSLDEIGKFLTVIRQGHSDVLIGCRNLRQNQPWYREFLGKGFTVLSSALVFCHYHDFTCGFKMFTAKASEKIFARQRIDDWAFDTEILYLANREHLKVDQLPVQWQHEGASKVRLGRDIVNSFVSLIKIRWYAFKGYYRS